MGKVEQIEALEIGKGIQYLLDSAYMILNNPINVIDINYNLLAFTDVPIDDQNWNELITTGTYSLETLELLASEGFIEDITNAEKTVVLRSRKLAHAKAAGHIFNKDNINVALVMMTEYGTAFDAENLKAFEALAKRITNEILDYDYFSIITMTFYEDKINLLLDGSIKNPFLFNPQAQILYSAFEEYLYVAVVSLEQNEILEHVHQNRLSYYKSVLKTQYRSYKYSVYSDNIIILMSSKSRYFFGAPLLTDNTGFFEQNGLHIGISESFENIYELRKYYEQAITALTNGLAANDSRRIFPHDVGLGERFS